MNKAQLIEALADRLGDKKTAQGAVDGMVDVIIRAVHKGDKVNITGFGVFEKRARAARTARNPRTGATVKVKKTNVPAFRAGSTFKDVISGSRKLPRVTAASKTGTASTTRAAAATRTAGSTTSRAAAPRATAARGAVRSTTSRASSVSKAPAAKTRAAAPKTATTARNAAPAKKTAAAAAKRTTTRKK